ncbi:MAG: VOC family protein [Candidatus Acidiferrales bacterium]
MKTNTNRSCAASLIAHAASIPTDENSVRGVKLKIVSAFTLIFALACFAAFIAGRAPMIAAESEQAAAKEESPTFLGLMNATYQYKNLDAAKAWYSKVLSIQPYFDQLYVGFNVHGYELGLVPETAAGEKRAASGVAYWRVKDARAAYQRLIDPGATPRELMQDVGGDILAASVHDPFGNILGIIQNPHFKTNGN